MRKFSFASEAAAKDYKALPESIQDEFGKDLRLIQLGKEPRLPIRYLKSVGVGVIELKKNGSPAFRCLYVAKYQDTVIVLHAFAKTTNGSDQPAMAVAKQRLKEILAELKLAH